MTIQLYGHDREEQRVIDRVLARILAYGLPVVGTFVLPKVSYNSDTRTYVLSVQYQGACYFGCINPVHIDDDPASAVIQVWEELMNSLILGKDD